MGGSAIEEEEATKMKRIVCVTGAGGFVASWLVKLLLSKGFIVHGTVRDPSDRKNEHLKKLENATENLRIFKADLLHIDSISPAIAGCEGVFHVASSVPSSKVSNPEDEVISPAVIGTLNVRKACSEAKVQRVVVVSSIVAVTVNPNWHFGTVLDESCWLDTQYCKASENWYSAFAEWEALDYAEKQGLDVVTVLPSLVFGPMLQTNVNASSLVLINIMKGTRESMENKTSHIVDVRDVADAILLVYEKPESLREIHLLISCYKNERTAGQSQGIVSKLRVSKKVEAGPVLSLEKLQKLGWRCRPLEETLVDTVEYYKSANLLDKIN